jgi:hypothetical protein
MRYYYVLSLNEIKKVKDISPIIKNYVDMKGFSCLNNKHIASLVTRLKLPFVDILCDVFTYFLQIEYIIAVKLTTNPKLKHSALTGRFGEHYYTLLKESGNPNLEEKCNFVSQLLEQSFIFFYSNKDTFLKLRNVSNFRDVFSYKSPELKGNEFKDNEFKDLLEETVPKQNARINYSHVVILLDSGKRYIAHASIQSWLSLDNLYKGQLYTLEIGNIKTSLANLLFSKEKNIKTSLISAIKQWAKQHYWESLHLNIQVSYALAKYLADCGFTSHLTASIDKLTLPEENIVEISEKTDLFSSCICDIDFYSWIRIKLEQCEILSEDNWISYTIVKNICTLLLISYPDRKPCKEEIEWIYIATFRNNSLGYCITVNPVLIKTITSIEDYSLVKEYIINSPPSLDREESLTYLGKINTAKFQVELEAKINYLSILEFQVGELNHKIRNCSSDITNTKTRREADKLIDKQLDGFESSESFIKIITGKEDLIVKMLLHLYIITLHYAIRVKLEFIQFMNWYKIVKCVKTELGLNYSEDYVMAKMDILKECFSQVYFISEELLQFLTQNSLADHSENIAHILRLEL